MFASARPSTQTDQTILRTEITRPPLFKEWQYEEYCRSLNWWILLLSGVSHDALQATIGMHESGPAKWVLVDYFAQKKSTPMHRTAEWYMEMMDSRFKRAIEDLALGKVSQRSDFKRKRTSISECFGCDLIVFNGNCEV